MTIPPFPIDPPPVAIPCESAGHAVEVLHLAHQNCLRASYVPHGGMGCTMDIPVTHTVWVLGEPKQIEIFQAELKLQTKETS